MCVVDLPQKIAYNYISLNGGFMLIGRDKEKNMLLSVLRSDKSEFVAVFGRRRVGKTYLVQESFRNYTTDPKSNFTFAHASDVCP